MKFQTAAEILTTISQMQYATQSSQGNRAKVNRLFNGDAPWSDAERRANRLNTAFNFLEPTRIAANSRYQIYNAFFTPGTFFDIRVDYGPPHKKQLWSACMTTYVNQQLRRSSQFRSALKQAHAQTVLHGPGPSLWPTRSRPAPNAIGVDDVLVPAGTLADMSNLDCLAIYREWTWSQLDDLTSGPAVDQGWNRSYVRALLKSLYKQPLQPLYQGNRWLFPEKIAEDIKENASAFAASSLGKLLAWDFYYRDEASGKWNRRILLDYNSIPVETRRTLKTPDFIYRRDDYASNWSEIIHWFIGNCSNVAPFRYYSIRSIGYLMYGIGLLQNMFRCRIADHAMQSLLTWFRNVSEDDRERLEDIQLQHLGIFPDGVSMVGANERYTADWNLIGGQLQQLRQLMAESSSNFLPDIAVEGDKPAMTATESLIRNNASVTLTSAVLNELYDQAEPFYREICRRFCLKGNSDPMAVKVRQLMREDEIPLSVLDVDSWEITPNRIMGGGNRAVELTTARALFESRGAFGPQGSMIATRRYVLALTNDADITKEMVPDEPEISDSAVLANAAFGTLMEGVPFVNAPGINQVDYIETMLQLLAAGMAPLEALQEQPSAIAVNAERIAGLVNVAQNIEEHISILAQDDSERERVREYSQLITQAMQQLKAYGQRLGEMEQAQAEQQQGLTPEAQAKIISAQIVAENKAQLDAAKAAQKAQHKDAQFIADQERKNAETAAELQRKAVTVAADVAAKDLTTRAELIHGAREAEVAIDTERRKADIAVETAKKKADAQAAAAKKKAAARPKPAAKK